jgi:WD40 repeat protein
MKRNLHMLVLIFAFSQLNPMDRQENIFSLQDIKIFIKENPVVSFIAAIGVPTFLLLCYKKFITFPKALQFSHSVQNKNANSLNQSSDDIQVSLWIKPGDGDLIGLTSQDLEKYPVLDYYAVRFGSKNSKDAPLKIRTKKGLNELLSKKVGDFFREMALNSSEKQLLTIDAKKQQEIKEINFDEIYERVSTDISICMAYFLQSLSKDPGFLLTETAYHDVYPIAAKHQDKYFFTDKNIYWKTFSWNKQCFYDQNDKHLLTLKYGPTKLIDNGLLFIPAYNGRSILTRMYGNDAYVKIYDLMTNESVIINGDFSNFEISSDGHWMGVCSRGTDVIQIYDMDNINVPVANIKHDDLKDFIFSPDGSKLVSWDSHGKRIVMLWDLQNIKNIISTELCSDILQFSHVMWNSDNKHICLVGYGAGNYEYDKSSIKNVSNIVLMNIENKEGKMFGPFSQARIFPDQSDIILGEFVPGNYYSCTLIHKSGEQLVIPHDLQNLRCSINGDYIAFSAQSGACIFDHKMNPVFKVHCSMLAPFRLAPCAENIMIGRRFQGEKLKDCFSWSLPDERTKKSFKEISKATSVPQFLLLQEVCLQQRKPREVLILQEKEHQRIFKTFDASHQSFLKEKLYLELPQAS